LEVQVLHNKSTIENFLLKSPGIHAYCIGDLDDFFWSQTCWYALVDNGQIQSIALLYVGTETPTLLIFYDDSPTFSNELLIRIKTILPSKFYAHLGMGLIDVFGMQNAIEYYGVHYKMVLDKNPLGINDSNIRKLTIMDLPKLLDFYSISYPNNWFDEKMLKTNMYYGYFNADKMIGVAGVHVYSREYKIAALGNIATHPDYRGQKIGYKLTSKLCEDLIETVDTIGLNVSSKNDFAIKCYKGIGFEIIGEYEEFLVNNA